MAKHLTTKEQIEHWTILEQTKYKDWKIKKSNSFIYDIDDEEVIKCTQCNKHKLGNQFKLYRTIDQSNKTLYYGRKQHCTSCTNMRTRKWRYNDPEKVDSLLLETNCQICNDEFPSDRNKFIDHCHTTNNVRGVLCTKCNTLLGMIERKEQIFTNIKKYLK
jgi:hypothetical protein